MRQIVTFNRKHILTADYFLPPVPTNVTTPSLSQPLLALEQERSAIVQCLAEAQVPYYYMYRA